jgi:small subunit ribosomal protein S17e
LGKVRTEKVKKVARELIRRYPGKFTTDFESNKKVVMSYTQLDSLKMRNRIAGYISRLVSIQLALKGGEEVTEPEKAEETVNAELSETEKPTKTE